MVLSCAITFGTADPLPLAFQIVLIGDILVLKKIIDIAICCQARPQLEVFTSIRGKLRDTTSTLCRYS